MNNRQYSFEHLTKLFLDKGEILDRCVPGSKEQYVEWWHKCGSFQRTIWPGEPSDWELAREMYVVAKEILDERV